MGVREAVRRFWFGPEKAGGGILRSAQNDSPEERAMSLSDLDALLDRAILTGAGSSAGAWVDQNTAMTSAVVYACVNVLSQAIASLPLITYRRLPNGGKERAPEHRLYPILHTSPNPEMTSYELRACLVSHVCLWGNAYAEIEMSDAGVNGLWPLRPDRMAPARDEYNQLVYDYRLPDGTTKRFQAVQIMHWRGLSSNGIVGYSPIQQAAESIGVDLATRQFGAAFFGNGSQPGGVLMHPGRLSPEGAERLKKSWEQSHQGLSNAQRVAVLEEGVTWTSIGIPPEQAQFLETRKYGRSEIAALYRVPPHMIGDLERATFSNIEHQSLEFVKYTLYPWLVQIEQALLRDLFRISEGKRAHFAEHLVDGMLRGDIQSRYQAYNIAHMGGWMNADEIRALENMNPVPEGMGETYWIPANMMPVEVALEPPPSPLPSPPAPLPEGEGSDSEGEGGDSEGEGGEEAGERAASPFETIRREVRAQTGGANRHRLANTWERILADVGQRIVDGELKDIGAAQRRAGVDRAAFMRWFAGYLEKRPDAVRRLIEAPITSLSELVAVEVGRELQGRKDLKPLNEPERYGAFVGGFLASRSDVWAADLRRVVETAAEAALAEEEWAAEMDAALLHRGETEAGIWSRDMAHRSVNAFAKMGFLLGGATLLRWMALGSDSCPYCQQMDGQVVGIERTFLADGGTLAGGEYQAGADIGHPPLHGGCVCAIVAG